MVDETAPTSSLPAPADGKWIRGVSAAQSVSEAASHVLATRLAAVHHWLPLAAMRSEEDAEHVHGLRIAVRRAVEALRVFAGLIDKKQRAELCERLRRIRRAADSARNWDVMIERFSRDVHGPLL
jgi:CHAD domain-containing protein